jgi:hypothetical protein
MKAKGDFFISDKWKTTADEIYGEAKIIHQIFDSLQ